MKKLQDEERLIDLLEQKTFLWDVGTKEYHLKNKREKAYEEMRDALDIDVANIKAKIMSIRPQLGKELNKTKTKKSGQGVDENHKSNWVFWQKLQFLIPVMQAGKSRYSFFVYRMFRAFLHPGKHHPTMFSACSVNMFSAFARGLSRVPA